MTSHTLSYYALEPVRRVFRLALLQWFGLSKWHLASAENKPYIKDIVAFVNTLHYQSVCELGCGLGDILSRLKMPEKYGFDVNPRGEDSDDVQASKSDVRSLECCCGKPSFSQSGCVDPGQLDTRD